MSDLRIVNGSFYRGKELVPTVIGNPDQIKCLKSLEQQENQLKSPNGLELSVDYETKVEANVSFKCNCGHNVFFSSEADDEEDAFKDLLDNKKSCHNCKKAYITFKNEDDELAIKYNN